MKKLKILITNFRLSTRSGTELYVRDLADGLLHAGHEPMVYSPILGEVSNEIRRLTVPVTDSLHHIKCVPDIIHGQHHPTALAALLHFRHVPAVYCVHGWLPWMESPLKFPRIRHYIAVDDTCKDRLIKEHGIAEDNVSVVLNFADTLRFPANLSEFPPKPKQALIFSNNATEDTSIPLIRKVCRKMGILFDVIGSRAGKKSKSPESLLKNYDIVFAKGRSAIEALVCGATVIPCDYDLIGQMVTSENLESTQRLNFGIRALTSKLTSENLIEQILKYDAEDRKKVSDRMRIIGSRDRAIPEILSVYEQVLKHRSPFFRAKEFDKENEAIVDYLHWLTSEYNNVSDKIRSSYEIQASNKTLRSELEAYKKSENRQFT